MAYSQFIDGRLCSGTGEQVFDVMCASTGQCLGRYVRVQLREDRIVPGHDPLVCQRFERVGGGDSQVFRIA